MQYLYKPDDYESKLIIIYSINQLNISPSYTILSQVVSSGADIQYFELQAYLEALADMGSVEEEQVNGENVYMLTALGEETCKYFADRIPASVRDKIKDAASLVNNDRSDLDKVYADYIPLNETEYKVVCGIMENNVKLLDFEMYAGSKDRAKKICKYFKEHTNEFYINIISHLEQNINFNE